MSPIESSNARVMAGKAMLTDVSSCVAAVPSPITATCQGLAWSRPVEVWDVRLEIEVTPQNLTGLISFGQSILRLKASFSSGGSVQDPHPTGIIVCAPRSAGQTK